MKRHKSKSAPRANRSALQRTKQNEQVSTKSIPQDITPRQAKQRLILELCCPKHSDLIYHELKRLYRTRQLCEIHTEVRGLSAESLIDKIQRLNGGIFKYQPIPGGLKPCEFSISLEDSHE